MRRRTYICAVIGASSLAGCPSGSGSEPSDENGSESTNETGTPTPTPEEDSNPSSSEVKQEDLHEYYTSDDLFQFAVQGKAYSQDARYYDFEANDLRRVEPENGRFLKPSYEAIYLGEEEDVAPPIMGYPVMADDGSWYNPISELPNGVSVEHIRDEYLGQQASGPEYENSNNYTQYYYHGPVYDVPVSDYYVVDLSKDIPEDESPAYLYIDAE